MDKIDIINNIFKFFFINMCIYYIFFKIIDLKNKNCSVLFFIVISSIFIAISDVVILKYTKSTFFLLIFHVVYPIIFSIIINAKYNYTIVPVTISIVIAYTIYIISVVISGIIMYKIHISSNNPINIILISCIETFFVYYLFKIKRFKNGFNFLKNTNRIESIGKFSFFLSIIVILIFAILHSYINLITSSLLFMFTIFMATFFTIWIFYQITKRYKENMKNRTIELQKIEIDEQLENIKELKENNLKLSTVIHKYNNRLSALEKVNPNRIIVDSPCGQNIQMIILNCFYLFLSYS